VGQSIRQLNAGHLRRLLQSVKSLSNIRLPAISIPISFTHQQIFFFGSHCTFSNSPVTLLQRGMNWGGPVAPRARERLMAARAKCSHPVSSVVTQRKPHLVMQQRSPGLSWHWESFSQVDACEGQVVTSRGHRSIAFSGSAKHRSCDLRDCMSAIGTCSWKRSYIYVSKKMTSNKVYMCSHALSFSIRGLLGASWRLDRRFWSRWFHRRSAIR